MQNIDDILKVRIQVHLAPTRIVDVKAEEVEDHGGSGPKHQLGL